jgi:holo-[acyl-carrier protein] synthase
MILGVGTDIVDCRRISAALARHGGRFERRIFTPLERAAAKSSADPALFFAKRFAVKEAVYKALNASGVLGRGWLEAETLREAGGAPLLTLSGRCKTALEAMTPGGYKASPFVSLSDEPPYALAFVIINAIPLKWTAPDE